MHIDSLYPSRFLRCADLNGRPMRVTIEGLKTEDIGGESKVVLSFTNGTKALILNKTNGKAIAKAIGTETSAWRGKAIVLVPAQVDFRGDIVDAIRIRAASPQESSRRPAKRPTSKTTSRCDAKAARTVCGRPFRPFRPFRPREFRCPRFREPHPKTHCGDLAAPPAALNPLCLDDHWLVWKWQRNGTAGPSRRSALTTQTRHAASNDPRRGRTHRAAVTAVLAGKASGIGFVLTGTKIGAIDLDHCRDPETGASTPGRRRSWTPRRPLITRSRFPAPACASSESRRATSSIGSSPCGGRPEAAIEIYRQATRYITVSGLEISHCVELPNIDALIDDLVARHGGNGSGNGFDFDKDDQQGERKEEPKPEWTEHEEARIRARAQVHSGRRPTSLVACRHGAALDRLGR